jgi:hypothetical protein
MAPKPDRLAGHLFAKATTKFGLATAIAALWLTALPLASAVAQEPGLSAARAAALQECNRLAARYPTNDWGNHGTYLYRSCMARHGQKE